MAHAAVDITIVTWESAGGGVNAKAMQGGERRYKRSEYRTKGSEPTQDGACDYEGLRTMEDWRSGIVSRVGIQLMEQGLKMESRRSSAENYFGSTKSLASTIDVERPSSGQAESAPPPHYDETRAKCGVS